MHHTIHHASHHGRRRNKPSYAKTVLFGLMLGLFGFGVFTMGAKGQSLLVSEKNPAGEIGADLVVTLRQLNSITLNRDIFQNPVFLNLQDFGLEVVPEPYQRANPFAPIGLE